MTQHFIGPAWDANGEPFLVEIPGGSGWRSESHRRRTRAVIDDFGNAVMYQRRCSYCCRWLPLTFDWFHAHARGSKGMRRICISCSTWQKYSSFRLDPDRKRELARAGYRRRMQDPEYRARIMARTKANKEQRKAADPEKFRREVRESSVRYRARIAADEERRKRYNESHRIAYRLRLEQDGGRSVTETASQKVALPKDRSVWRMSLPGEPLAAVLYREIERRQVAGDESPVNDLFALLGCEPRALSRWAHGDRANVKSIDQACVALEVNWWDIYDPAEFPEAVVLFEGEAKAA